MMRPRSAAPLPPGQDKLQGAIGDGPGGGGAVDEGQHLRRRLRGHGRRERGVAGEGVRLAPGQLGEDQRPGRIPVGPGQVPDRTFREPLASMGRYPQRHRLLGARAAMQARLPQRSVNRAGATGHRPPPKQAFLVCDPPERPYLVTGPPAACAGGLAALAAGVPLTRRAGRGTEDDPFKIHLRMVPGSGFTAGRIGASTPSPRRTLLRP
jgi:hypothetical protein